MARPPALAKRPDFRLGAATVRPSLRTIEGPGGAATAEPRVMQVLIALVDAEGAVLTREDLIRICWNGQVVGDDSINRAIAEVRRLARRTEGGFAVETIPRIGYRVTGATADAVAPADAQAPAPSAATARGSSRRRFVAGAAAVAAAAGVGLWASLRMHSDGRFEQLVNKGDQALHYGAPESIPQAVSALQQAVTIRADDSRAWGIFGLAQARAAIAARAARSGHVAQEAERAARTALSIDAREPNALLALLTLQGSLLDWATIEDRLSEIIRIQPTHTLAMQDLILLYQAAGRARLSWDWNERAISIEPLSPMHQSRRAMKHWIFGRIADADRVLERAMQFWPSHPNVLNAQLIIFAFTGRERAAIAMLDDPQMLKHSVAPAAAHVWRTSLSALEQRTPASIEAARVANLEGARLSPGVAAYGAMFLSGLGETDAAFDIAEGFLLSRGSILVQPQADPSQFFNDPDWRRTQWLFTPPTAAMRKSDRFKPLCDGIGLTEYWRKRQLRPDKVSGD